MRSELIANFDLYAYLDDRGIQYKTHGQDIGHGWIGMPCVFCNDHATHLGINLESKFFKCWLCNAKGSIVDFIKGVDEVSTKEAIETAEGFTLGWEHGWDEEDEFDEHKRKKGDILPVGFKYITARSAPPLVRHWFKKRKFPLSFCEEYRLGFCRMGGDHPLHLIIPITMNHRLVSYIAADLTGYADNKYVMCPNAVALVEKNGVVFGVDEIVDLKKVVIVEGVTDKWRVGINAVAFLTKNWHTNQVLQLQKKTSHKTKVIVLLDADAKRKAKELSAALQLFYKKVYTVQIEKKDRSSDPDGLSKKLIKRILSV